MKGFLMRSHNLFCLAVPILIFAIDQRSCLAQQSAPPSRSLKIRSIPPCSKCGQPVVGPCWDRASGDSVPDASEWLCARCCVAANREWACKRYHSSPRINLEALINTGDGWSSESFKEGVCARCGAVTDRWCLDLYSGSRPVSPAILEGLIFGLASDECLNLQPWPPSHPEAPRWLGKPLCEKCCEALNELEDAAPEEPLPGEVAGGQCRIVGISEGAGELYPCVICGKPTRNLAEYRPESAPTGASDADGTYSRGSVCTSCCEKLNDAPNPASGSTDLEELRRRTVEFLNRNRAASPKPGESSSTVTVKKGARDSPPEDE